MRWPRRVVVAVGAGVLVNVAVAWALARWAPVDVNKNEIGYQVHRGKGSIRATGYMRIQRAGVEMLHWWDPAEQFDEVLEARLKKEAPAWSLVRARQGCVHDRVMHHWELAAGWPMLSLRCCVVKDAATGAMELDPAWSGFGLKLENVNWTTVPRMFPLFVVWQGFVVNTLVCVAAAMGLMMVPGVVVRRWRRGRGLCEGCGYPVPGGGVCSECGRDCVK